jgi:UDP-N-acetyl-D-mannosaminuronic acid transferase (WecB/TagA/CpsF family)
MKTQTVLGVPFFAEPPGLVLETARAGGLIVAPSGPGLVVDLARDPAYRTAVTTADLALPDSGFMALIWNFLGLFARRQRLKRLSGLRFLRMLMGDADVQVAGATFWVMPSEEERDRNLAWLRLNGFNHLGVDDCYVAPDYRRGGHRNANGDLTDEVLAQLIEDRAPQWVILNIGSGTQEPLGHWLRSRLSGNPSIVCTGAAIAFLTGGQVAISPWADRLFLGWLLRVMHSPRSFFPRYIKALYLVPVLVRWQSQLPPLKAANALGSGNER